MKALKCTAAVAVAMLLTLFAFPAFGAGQGNYSTVDYYIQSYAVNIEVSAENTFYITENISAYFNVQKHGIYRTLPLTNTVEREDGSTEKIRAKVKNLNVSEVYEAYTENGDYVIQIGSESETLLGAQDYTISYAYVLGQDTNADFDELYYNIIGTQWDTYIENISFTITMPKAFDESLLGFSAGTYGTAGTEAVQYSVDGLTITGACTETLYPYEGLTVRLQLPDGYFDFNYIAYYAKLGLMVLLPAALLFAVLFLWQRHGKDKKVFDVVEFYPPAGMSAVDVTFWCKGSIENTDVVPLMIELANEGYIHIAEKQTGALFKKNAFVIERVRDYDGDDENKKIFFKGLFKSKKITRVTNSDLQDSFYMYANQIVSRTNTRKNKHLVFSKKSLQIRIVCWLLSILGAVAVLFISSGIIGGTLKYIFLFAGLFISLISFVLSFFLRRRTDAGHEMLQRINGFKLFLKTAEKERLETLVYDNPKYFYDILPYAYVLGVSKEWTKKFESIAMEPPGWYYGSSAFDYVVFSSFMARTMRTAGAAMVSTPQETTGSGVGGGGFSGGGFSGGGVGGGGGGSW